MRPALLRLAEVEPSLVKDYLAHQGIPAHIADWKYFDSRFSRNLDRGFVCVNSDKVCGFLGLIPFKARKDGRTLECAWSCDWSIEASQAAAGMGIMLLKQAQDAYQGIFNVGGNENTRRIFPRLAERTVWDAGVNLVLPLRLGPSLAGVAPRFLRRTLMQGFWRNVPLKWVRSRSKDQGIRMEPGVSAEIAPLIENAAQDWCPAYDFEYVRWQLETCPAVVCWSCFLPAGRQSAVIVWRSVDSTDYWRLVVLGVRTAKSEARLLLSRAIEFVYKQNGAALSAITSHLDRELLDLLTSHGFLCRRSRLPFYAMRGRDTSVSFDEFTVLNFLDADQAYRFRL